MNLRSVVFAGILWSAAAVPQSSAQTVGELLTYGEEAALRHAENLEKLTSSQGHIVVRVAPGGGSYRVIVLEDSRESFRIKSVHGRYESR
jgi:hypothetical protein